MVASIVALGSLNGTTRFVEPNVAGESQLSPTADALAARTTFQLSKEHAGFISGRTSGARGAITLTALRYAPFGDSWIVTQFANVMQGQAGTFELAGLPSGAWVIAARGGEQGALFWGRTDPIWVHPNGSRADAPIELESYGVSVRIRGIPKSHLGRAQLSLEWVQSDRVLAESAEFLDASDLLGPQPDSFQVFGSLESVGTPWMSGVAEPVAPASGRALTFDAGLDPFGQERWSRSWISPCPLGTAALGVPGPGLVTVRLHGSAGLWSEAVATVEVRRGDSNASITLQADCIGAAQPIAPCSTALAATSRATQR